MAKATVVSRITATVIAAIAAFITPIVYLTALEWHQCFPSVEECKGKGEFLQCLI